MDKTPSPQMHKELLRELMDAVDSGIPVDRIRNSPLAVRIDAALEQPAPSPEPEGREPASVVSEPSDEELDAMERQCYLATEVGNDSGCEYVFEHRRYARAVLARYGHHPAPPAAGEVGELVAWLRDRAESTSLAHTALRITRAADLLEQRHPAPVPVSERLPGPEDCDAEGRCWWFCTEYPGEWPHWIFGTEVFCGPTHWLPANALPLPSEEVK